MTTTTPEATTSGTPESQRDVLFALGMAAVSLAAAISSYSGLASLADLVGWNHRLGLLLPLTIDAYALTATRVWLSPKTASRKARRWAKGNAIGAIATSVAGNAVSHAANAHVFHVTWPIVVAVSAIPSIVLGLITHLWHLRNTPEAAPVPVAVETQSADAVPAPVPDQVPAIEAEAETPAPRTQQRTTGRKSTAAAVAALRAKHPELSQVAVAKRLKVTDRTVRKYWTDTAAPEAA
jgi:DNA-binding transcriptional regulator YiaG